ncbi:MAG: beta-lactamase family protein [Kordiimonadaceae bacterium]|nr:beta-lactamase family protein [Kordiimonadaceae bacterium]
MFCVPYAASTAQAAQPSEAEIDAVFERIMKENHVPGAAISIMHKDKMIFAKGYGYSNLEHRVTTKPEVIFQSASVGKMFTSAAILLLEKDGKLSLQDNILKHLPSGPKTWADITPQQMMMHRSGMPDYEGDIPEEEEDLALRAEFSDDDFIAALQTKPLEFTPGTQYSYSNTAYILLGAVIRKVSGQFYGDFLQDRVFGPIGMKTAQVNDIDQIIPNRSQGYRPKGDGLIRDEFVSHSLSRTADGSLLFSVLDMAEWNKELFYDNKILSRETVQEILKRRPYSDGTSQPSGYGYGWALTNVRGHEIVKHSGAWQGFSTYYLRAPEKDLSVVVLLNLAGGDAGRFSKTILGLFDSNYTSYAAVDDNLYGLTKKHQALVAAYLSGNRLGNGYTKTAASRLGGKTQQRAITDSAEAGDTEKFVLVHVNEDLNLRTYKSNYLLIDVDMNANGLVENLRFDEVY